MGYFLILAVLISGICLLHLGINHEVKYCSKCKHYYRGLRCNLCKNK